MVSDTETPGRTRGEVRVSVGGVTSDSDLRTDVERCLLAYARGVDRLDGDLIATAFHPGATLDGYGSAAVIPVGAFVARVVESLGSKYVATQHRISNTWIDRRDDHAIVETYVYAFHITAATDEQPAQKVSFAGRYIDRFEARDGEWRIAHRSLRADWSEINDLGEPMVADWVAGSRDRSDPSYG
jgi:hypothetical protein